MDLRQTSEHARYMESIGWIIERDNRTNSNIFVRKIPLSPFSVIKIQRPEDLISWEYLSKLVRKYRAIQTNIETLDDAKVSLLAKSGYKRSKIPFIPSTTILVDITLSKKHLLSMMKSKTRYNIGLAERRGVNTRVIDGNELLKNKQLFDDLFNMQKQNAKRLGIFVLPKKWFENQVRSFGKNCFAVMAYLKNELVAATFYMVSNDGVYYSHNGSTISGRKNFAPTLCVWVGMLEGKKRGLKFLDFEGVYDPRSKVVKWQGFTRFKEGFGGKTVMYPGLYSKWHLFGF